MYWDDLRALIRRHQAPNADIRYYYDKADPTSITVFDRGITRRQPSRLEKTGYTEEDKWRDSQICRAAFFNGEIPMEGHEPKADRKADKLIGEPYRGALSVLTLLLGEGSLEASDELRELFARHGRRFPKAAIPGLAPS